MTAEILKEREIEYYIRTWQLVPSSGGVFNITVNGERIFSKKELGRHLEDGEGKRLIAEKIGAIRDTNPS
ncbi:MAG: Rdx family protein [Anaerolineae bacterium]|nr:Rdx family protein [Anaerolineae bacterium]